MKEQRTGHFSHPLLITASQPTDGWLSRDRGQAAGICSWEGLQILDLRDAWLLMDDEGLQETQQRQCRTVKENKVKLPPSSPFSSHPW